MRECDSSGRSHCSETEGASDERRRLRRPGRPSRPRFPLPQGDGWVAGSALCSRRRSLRDADASGWPEGKARPPKSIPLTQREALLLKEQLLARTAGTTLLFPNKKGEQWNRHRFRDQVWQSAIEAAGYDSLGFHQLRHTAISLMCRAGYRPEWVAERVGHADGGALILKRYRHLYPSESYAAAPSLDALVAAKTG